MSDKTEPLAGLDRHRAAVLALLMARESNPWMDRWVEAALAAADAADRAAGVVRVDTNDEALVERMAEAVCFNGNPWPCYAANSHRDQARAVLAALREES